MANKQQPNWHRYTFIAIIVAVLACIVAGFFLILLGTLNIGLFSGMTKEAITKGIILSGSVVLLALAIYLLLEPDKVRRTFTGRQARYGSNAVIMSIAFIGILVVANVFAYQNPDLHKDITEDKQNTLAPESVQALAQLKEPVTATAFYSTNISSQSADELLAKFKAASSDKFDYKFVNPDTDPLTAKNAGITGDGKILLTMGDRKEIAGYASETEITKALYRLINPEPRVIYFLTGHGEASLESGQGSMTKAKQNLENKNYTVKSLNLLAENKIPEDALTIVIAGPMKPVSDQEVTLLKNYVDGGGSLLVMENPILATDFGDSADPLADYLTKDWGITLDNDVIIDLSSQQPLYAVSASAGNHPITQNLTQNYIVIMPQARSITTQLGAENITVTNLLMTSANSWGEKNFTNAQGSQVKLDPEDTQGPLVMAAAGENTQTKGRVVVFGNSLFATDDGYDAYGNGNIFINSLDWAAFQEDAISVTPYTPTTRTFVAPDQTRWIIILLGSVIVLPGLVVFAGISTWLARRRQG
ncbi:MAG: Gldg family protein [Anaerolineales bacterium]